MAYNTIKVKKYSDVIEEITAGGAITPGMLLELDSSGEVVAHNSAGENALPMFALENELEGKGIDDAYEEDDKVQVWIPYRGDMVYAILEDGENVSIGDFVESAGNGNVQKHVPDVESADSNQVVDFTAYSNQIVGVAVEAVDLEASSGGESSGIQGDQRILIRII